MILWDGREIPRLGIGCRVTGSPFYAGDAKLGWAKSMTMNDPLYRGVCVSFPPSYSSAPTASQATRRIRGSYGADGPAQRRGPCKSQDGTRETAYPQQGLTNRYVTRGRWLLEALLSHDALRSLRYVCLSLLPQVGQR